MKKNMIKKILPVCLAVGSILIATHADAGTSTVLSDVETETKNAAFGTGAKTGIELGSLAGAVMAATMGKWLFAGLGLAVGGLMFLSTKMAGSTAFSALIQ